MRRGLVPVVLVVVLVGLGSAGCRFDVGASSAASGSAAVPAPNVTGDRAALLAQLGAAQVEDTGAHYERADWGEWAYDSASKCNTREQVLIRDGDGEQVDGQCRAQCPRKAPEAACWVSRYDGVAAYDPGELQIDHLVPLAEANRSGARGWSAEQRSAFYNDPANLVAVSGKSNGQKSDGDPGVWRPAEAYWCDYATAYVNVKVAYKLTADQRELAELTAMLGRCPA